MLTFAAFSAPIAVAAGLPAARNLQADALRARPVLVFFSARSCAYCKEVENLYLKPMYADAGYRDKVIIRQVDIDSTRVMRDFSGKSTSGVAFARRYGVSLTPTIKFLDARGRELVPALVGVSSPDFYGSYLDQAITAAGARLREHSARHPPSLSKHSHSGRQAAAASVVLHSVWNLSGC
ncbi:MAG: thioredoxin fold domain-containing protein [Acidiferrobacterales bacterium]